MLLKKIIYDTVPGEIFKIITKIVKKSSHFCDLYRYEIKHGLCTLESIANFLILCVSGVL